MSFYPFLCKWKRQKMVAFFVKQYAVAYARPKMAVPSTQCQNRAVRNAQGGGVDTLLGW